MSQKTGSASIYGAFVGHVASLSLGEKAGLRSGDIITEVNLRPIRNTDDLEQILSGLMAGNRVSIVFTRGDETLRSEIVV
jgi:S1-C subfamily serine protease